MATILPFVKDGGVGLRGHYSYVDLIMEDD